MKIEGREISAKLRWNTILKPANQLLLCCSSTEGVASMFPYIWVKTYVLETNRISLPYRNE